MVLGVRCLEAGSISCPKLAMVILLFLPFLGAEHSVAPTMLTPSFTFPKVMCFPCSHYLVLALQRQRWELLVFGLAVATETTPGPGCWMLHGEVLILKVLSVDGLCRQCHYGV